MMTDGVCTLTMKSGWRRWRRTRRSAIAGPQAGPAHKAGCTTAPAKLAPGKPLSREERGDNADAHLKRHGPPSEAVVVAITNGRLDFGMWDQIS
jgi:hypothetical protein